MTKKICVHCGKNGHTIDVYYKKHGFPPGFKFSNSKANSIKMKEVQQEGNQDTGHQEQDFRLISQKYQALMSLLQNSNKEGFVPDSHVNKINTISSYLA